MICLTTVFCTNLFVLEFVFRLVLVLVRVRVGDYDQVRLRVQGLEKSYC